MRTRASNLASVNVRRVLVRARILSGTDRAEYVLCGEAELPGWSLPVSAIMPEPPAQHIKLSYMKGEQLRTDSFGSMEGLLRRLRREFGLHQEFALLVFDPTIVIDWCGPERGMEALMHTTKVALP